MSRELAGTGLVAWLRCFKAGQGFGVAFERKGHSDKCPKKAIVEMSERKGYFEKDPNGEI